MEINVIVNGETRTFDAEPGQNLVSVLRENGYTEVRTGCDTGSCGLCTVWIDGKPTLSCSTLAMRVNGKKITTIKGVGKMGQAWQSTL